jgi:hypothetical protein
MEYVDTSAYPNYIGLAALRVLNSLTVYSSKRKRLLNRFSLLNFRLLIRSYALNYLIVQPLLKQCSRNKSTAAKSKLLHWRSLRDEETVVLGRICKLAGCTVMFVAQLAWCKHVPT